MPSSRLLPPPQTSKQARRAYLKSTKHFEYTATQKRVSERRLELDKRAKALQAKEQRQKDNKRKREDKEAAEREAKTKRIESGKVPIEAHWGKVRASQPRLNAFFAQPKAEDKEGNDRSQSEEEESSDYDYNLKETVIDHRSEEVFQEFATDTNELENFFSSAASTDSEEMSQALDISAGKHLVQPGVGATSIDSHIDKSVSSSPPSDPEQALLDTQLSLSQGVFDFDIAEDDDAEWTPQPAKGPIQPDSVRLDDPQNHLLATPSKRKAGDSDFDFLSPAKSARSALSEMSPSKVNVRAQEKPDISSVTSFKARMPTPSPPKQPGSQSAAEVLAMIATQDLEDEEFVTDKENKDPWQVESKTQSHTHRDSKITKGLVKSNANLDAPGYGAHVRRPHLQHQSFDEDIFDEDEFGELELGYEDEQDDFDNDLDDETLAALAAKSPSKQKAPGYAVRVSRAPASSKLEELTFRDVSTDSKSSKVSGNLIFTSATIMPPPQVSLTRPSIQPHTVQPQQKPPQATQGNSFAFDDVQDDDLTAFAEELDTSDAVPLPRIESKTKPSRTIPWNQSPQFPASQSLDESPTQDGDPYDL